MPGNQVWATGSTNPSVISGARQPGCKNTATWRRNPRRVHMTPTALDNGRRSPRKLPRGGVARLLGRKPRSERLRKGGGTFVVMSASNVPCRGFGRWLPSLSP